jgi:uncharacterized protein
LTTYLLDINLLLALTDPMHIHHEAASRWFTDLDTGGRESLELIPVAAK